MGIIFKKDSEWSVIDGEPCRVVSFNPSVSVQNGKLINSSSTEPYAYVLLESKKLSQQAKGFIVHKSDFVHLWLAFKDRGIGQDEEVILIWTKKHYKTYAKIFSIFMPKLWVMVCKKGAFELITDSNYKPELTGEARWIEEKPIADWKPEVMK